jgi:hypothetical protein
MHIAFAPAFNQTKKIFADMKRRPNDLRSTSLQD